ncbi:hypothetical protein PoB_007487400 [Plakobranchus ocellatus]|uniref:Uncharacterized protein n=1 Tax=Plakobranchus ocellatus TaxID=259542 RepID=A0AAV4DVZ3_9GAST|nr:hypothetical protein PoB_007487400 [Plakobranchus ocellatus]
MFIVLNFCTQLEYIALTEIHGVSQRHVTRLTTDLDTLNRRTTVEALRSVYDFDYQINPFYPLVVGSGALQVYQASVKLQAPERPIEGAELEMVFR